MRIKELNKKRKFKRHSKLKGISKLKRTISKIPAYFARNKIAGLDALKERMFRKPLKTT
jgi:hypothetical protein